jgi:hypothetical protein
MNLMQATARQLQPIRDEFRRLLVVAVRGVSGVIQIAPLPPGGRVAKTDSASALALAPRSVW